MSRIYTGGGANFDDGDPTELERLLVEGIDLEVRAGSPAPPRRQAGEDAGGDPGGRRERDGDLQGATGLFAEAAQDMATAGLELSLGRNFACVDFCNQAAEKAAQAVSLLRFGHRSTYDHDLATLGALVGAPAGIQDEMATLTPFHPETFYIETPPEEADEVISAEQAAIYVQNARHVLSWARSIVLGA
jgi:HEPN domain-containing protein